MTINLTILGLGRLGGSLALRLAGRSDPSSPAAGQALRVSGYDIDPGTAKRAQSEGTLYKAHWNLINAVEGADLVVAALPYAEQREAIQLLAGDLRPGGVMVALGTLLGQPLAWASEAFVHHADRHFIAAHAALNPAVLHNGDNGPAAARVDLFEKGVWALAPAPNCAPEGLRLAADLARLAGAAPYFVDPAEHDGLAAATENLPALLAWALMRAAAASPGWPEARKVADRSFATATAALAEAEAPALRANRENLLRYLDAALAELGELRGWLERDDGPSLTAALNEAADARALWVHERSQGNWDAIGDTPAMPTAGDVLGRMLVGGLFGKRGAKDDKG
jgi:prephenate dehydrogenase